MKSIDADGSANITKDHAYHTSQCYYLGTTVPIGYSNLGYSGRAAYSDLNPNGTWSSHST